MDRTGRFVFDHALEEADLLLVRPWVVEEVVVGVVLVFFCWCWGFGLAGWCGGYCVRGLGALSRRHGCNACSQCVVD